MPNVPRAVVIVAPHTSNWDFAVGLVCGYAAGILSAWPYGFLVKASLFRGPVGAVRRRLGGIPIDRRAPHGVVGQLTDILGRRERFLLVITPEGTRKRTAHWKSGFYHIAFGAGVPIVPVAFDYARRLCRIGGAILPSGNPEADLETFRSFYAGVTAKWPARAGEIRFKDYEAFPD